MSTSVSIFDVNMSIGPFLAPFKTFYLGNHKSELKSV
jgi:hypothetical protein